MATQKKKVIESEIQRLIEDGKKTISGKKQSPTDRVIEKDTDIKTSGNFKNDPDLIATTIYLPPVLKNKLKAEAALQGIRLQDIFVKAIEKYVATLG